MRLDSTVCSLNRYGASEVWLASDEKWETLAIEMKMNHPKINTSATSYSMDAIQSSYNMYIYNIGGNIMVHQRHR